MEWIALLLCGLKAMPRFRPFDLSELLLIEPKPCDIISLNMAAPGFGNLAKLHDHFQEHGTDFGSPDADHYEKAAVTFLTSPISGTVQECRRKGGDIVRFDPATDSFGVLGAGSVVRTFYKPIKCSSLPAPIRASARARGRCHGYANNLLYYRAACAQR